MKEKYYFIILVLCLIWNFFVFLLMGIDKRKAIKGSWRISEKALLFCAFFFGGVGAFLGMKVFHHKTKHWYFRFLLPLFSLLQIAGWAYFYFVV